MDATKHVNSVYKRFTRKTKSAIMIAEIIDEHTYEVPAVAEQLETLTGINSGFKRTILEWIHSGHIVSITKDKYNNCLKYDFKINSKKPPRSGQLVIQNVF